MKIYINKVRENWVVDNFINEWKEYNGDTTVKYAKNAELIWMIAPWTWNRISKRHLTKKKVICTIHHIDFNKFDDAERINFYDRDRYIDFYHVISEKTKNQLKKLTNKKIFIQPFWIDQRKFHYLHDKKSLRKKYKLNNESFLVGSFQRDTEGHDLISPKLSKGPDKFLEIVKDLQKTQNNLEVVLTGKRRNYLIKNFEENSINYKYFEMVDFATLNELYNILDLYIVSSRIEGGPRSVFECAQTETPIISTDVGFASEILAEESIYNFEDHLKARPNIEHAKNKVSNFLIPEGFQYYLNMFNEVYES
jgi:glycosyltransferase involved in cell wall biosynthesis